MVSKFDYNSSLFYKITPLSDEIHLLSKALMDHCLFLTVKLCL